MNGFDDFMGYDRSLLHIIVLVGRGLERRKEMLMSRATRVHHVSKVVLQHMLMYVNPLFWVMRKCFSINVPI